MLRLLIRLWNRPVSRILYATHKAQRAIIHLGAPLLTRSGLLPACRGRATPGTLRHTHAYLKLLQIEVAAFHPVAPWLLDAACSTEVAVPVCDTAHPYDRLVSVALFLSSPQTAYRTAVSRYLALRSPDFPRCVHRDCPACPTRALYPARTCDNNSMHTPLITLNNIHLAFGHDPLLDAANLSILPGERIGLIGRNGAGKSSLLKLLDGRLEPDGGEIVRTGGLKIATVAQEPDMDATHSVQECLLADYATQEDWQRPARAQTFMAELGLDPGARPDALSGGQCKRVALARALLDTPDLLLLDEPTNHLDFSGIAWLEAQLQQATVIVITHDRRFLDAIATRIIELDRGQLFSFPGNFSVWQERKAAWLQAQTRQQQKFDKFLAQEEAWIRQGIEARRTRNEGRVRRLHALRHARAQRREQTGQARLALAQGQQSGKLVAELHHVHHQFDGRVLIRDFSTTILRGDRIGLIGANGAGKTTLLNIILGRLQPTSGTVHLGTRLSISYFDQMRASLDENATLADTISPGSEWVEIGQERKHVMRYLEDFLFPPARARFPVRSLSGGERARLILARLFARPANVLVLDEPTNDLDIETLELLEAQLQDYDGTVLLVSHDREFLNNIVTQTLAAEANGHWGEYVGGYDEWLAQRPSVAATQTVDPAKRMQPTTDINAQNAGRTRAPRNHRISPWEVRELAQVPEKIAALEIQQAELTRQLSDPALYRNGSQQLTNVQAQLHALMQQLEALYERWQVLEAKQQASTT